MIAGRYVKPSDNSGWGVLTDEEREMFGLAPIPATEQYIDLDQAERDTARGAVLTGLFIVGGIAAIVAAGVLVWSLAR